jgi:hypothetical protein
LGKLREQDTLLMVIGGRAEWIWTMYAEVQSFALAVVPLEDFGRIQENRPSWKVARSSS